MWLGIVKTLLSLAGSLMSYLDNKQLLEAGKAVADNEHLSKARDEYLKSQKIRDKVGGDFADALAARSKRLRDKSK